VGVCAGEEACIGEAAPMKHFRFMSTGERSKEESGVWTAVGKIHELQQGAHEHWGAVVFMRIGKRLCL